MLRSLFSGVSGLRAHQQMVDVTGNNIANVNTTGFRASSVQFADVLSQTETAGTAGNATSGSVNPMQVGLGVRVAAIATNNTAGSLENTGRSTDLALQGNGYFVLRNGSDQLLTRAGSFSFDSQGRLVDPSGGIVEGWMADAKGNVNTNGPLSDLVAGPGTVSPPTATTAVTVAGNLPASANVGDKYTSSINVYDSLGASHAIEFTMTKTGDNTWTQTAAGPDGTPLTPASVTLAFDPATGQLTSTTPTPSYTYTPSGASPVTFTTGYGTAGSSGALTQFGGEATMAATDQDGQANGFLRSVAIANGGNVVGTFSNGSTRVLGQVAIGQVTNPNGLEKVGDNHYRLSPSAGNLTIGAAGSAGRATVVAGALEASNVDLGEEFTNLIVAQRGFQANAKVITTSDQILQDLVQLKQ